MVAMGQLMEPLILLEGVDPGDLARARRALKGCACVVATWPLTRTSGWLSGPLAQTYGLNIRISITVVHVSYIAILVFVYFVCYIIDGSVV